MPWSQSFNTGVLIVGLALPSALVPGCKRESDSDSDTPAVRHDERMIRAINDGVALMEQYKYEEAVTAFEEAVKLAPDLLDARLNLVVATMNRAQREDVEQAVAMLENILAGHPENARALYLLGILSQYQGHDEEAVRYFTKVIELHPEDAHAWYMLARSRTDSGRPARDETLRAIELNPAMVGAYHLMLRIAREEGNDDEARGYQEKFLALRDETLRVEVAVPQYRRMGPLSLAQPINDGAPGAAGGVIKAGQTVELYRASGDTPFSSITSAALADIDNDGRPEICLVTGNGLRLLRQMESDWQNITDVANLAGLTKVNAASFGDFDNDGFIDLFICRDGPNVLFRNSRDGTFDNVTAQSNAAGGDVDSTSAVFLDADHDADLDLYVCNSDAANQLLNNDTGTIFTDIAGKANVTCAKRHSTAMVPVDVDNDRDTDMLVLHAKTPAIVFFNDRLGSFHEENVTPDPVHAAIGIAQDFNGDTHADFLALQPGELANCTLYLSEGSGNLKTSDQFGSVITSAQTWGSINTARVADLDLDGDLDILLVGSVVHALLNDGQGRFVLKPSLLPESLMSDAVFLDACDLNGDGMTDIILAGDDRLVRIPFDTDPPSNWLAFTPTGKRADDDSMRSPASGYGTRVQIQVGNRSQTIHYNGLNGGPCQSRMPWIVGLGAAAQADYVAMRWPDGVTQAELALAAGQLHELPEIERRISSCPVLFTWDGHHFQFITDFSGNGGLGYFTGPGQYAMPQPADFVRLAPGRLKPRDGLYELRACEPMEEVAYFDRFQLIAVDHPEDSSVYPDQRLAITGDLPTHKLLCIAEPLFPEHASDDEENDCTDRLRHIDREYAYDPPRDRRYLGFCKPHTLTLDFADRLGEHNRAKGVYLFLNGSIEYPYSQSTWAASQADIRWQPPRIDVQQPDGNWKTIIADAGTFGGIGRTIALDLTGRIPATRCRIRITTNLELYYDQAFIGIDRGTAGIPRHHVPLVAADLRRLGFPLEYSPDGRHPTIYSYDLIEPTCSFKLPAGRYTRYGPVAELLTAFDDRYAIVGSGDEVALRFDANAVPEIPDGCHRTFIFVSNAWCKDMDLYTATPDTVEPLPFRTMSSYPCPDSERRPDDEQTRRILREYNTRLIH